MARRSNTVIPSVPKNLDPSVRQFLEAIREEAEVLGGKGRGDKLDRALTLRDLSDALGLRTSNAQRLIDGLSQSTIVYNDPFPSAPTGVQAYATITSVVIVWDQVTAREWYLGTEVYRYVTTEDDTTPNFGAATYVGTTRSFQFTDSVPSDTTVTYWIRHLNRDQKAGPPHSPEGVTVTTHVKPSDALEGISEEIRQSPLYEWLNGPLQDSEILRRLERNLPIAPGEQASWEPPRTLNDMLAESNISSRLNMYSSTEQIKQQQSKNFARLSSGIHAAVNADESYVARIAALESQWQNDLGTIVQARVDTLSEALTGPNGAFTNLETSLTGLFDENVGAINDIARVTSEADGVLTERLNALESVVVDGETSLTALVAGHERALTAPDGALAESLSELRASIESPEGELFSAIEEVKRTTVSSDAYEALWGVKLEANGRTGGFGLYNNGQKVEFYIKADQFSILSPDSETVVTPFTIDSEGNVVMKSALIDTAVISNLVVEQLNVDEIVATRLISAPTIQGATLEGGTLSIGDGIFRVSDTGRLTAKAGTLDNITINETCTIKGKLRAENIEGDTVHIKNYDVRLDTVGDVPSRAGAKGREISVTIAKANYTRTLIMHAVRFSWRNVGDTPGIVEARVTHGTNTHSVAYFQSDKPNDYTDSFMLPAFTLAIPANQTVTLKFIVATYQAGAFNFDDTKAVFQIFKKSSLTNPLS